MRFFILLLLFSSALLLSSCSHCPICYQDAWSREPFPGQAKQHIPPLDPSASPDNVPAPGPMALPPDDDAPQQ